MFVENFGHASFLSIKNCCQLEWRVFFVKYEGKSILIFLSDCTTEPMTSRWQYWQKIVWFGYFNRWYHTILWYFLNLMYCLNIMDNWMPDPVPDYFIINVYWNPLYNQPVLGFGHFEVFLLIMDFLLKDGLNLSS